MAKTERKHPKKPECKKVRRKRTNELVIDTCTSVEIEQNKPNLQEFEDSNSEKSTILIDDDDENSVVDLSMVDYDCMPDVVYLKSHFIGDSTDRKISEVQERRKFSYRLFQCTKAGYSLVLLRSTSDSYPIVETARYLNVLGSVRIFGYDLPLCGSTSKECTSWTTINTMSVSAPVLYVENTTMDSMGNSSLQNSTFLQYIMEYCSENDARDIKSLVQDQSACFFVQKLNGIPEALQFVRHVFNDRSFLPSPNEKKETIGSGKTQRCIEYRNDHIVYSETHETEINEILCSAEETIKNFGANFVCSLTGPCNVGKSTFSRLLINRALSKNMAVFHLECDCGQAEFTLSGCLSLTRVTNAVFGDSFTHLRKPELCYYFGHISPATRIDEYLDMVYRLKKRFDQMTLNGERALLVSNTNGWIHGPGLEVLQQVLQILTPNHVTSIHFGQLTGKNDLASQLRPLFQDTVNLRNISAAVEPNNLAKHKNSRLLRDLCTVSFFGQIFKDAWEGSEIDEGRCNFFNLRSVTPYKVEWNKLKVQVLHGHAPPGHLLAILNANLVALCKSSVNTTQVMEEETCWLNNDHNLMLFQDTTPPECVGFGIVRAINPDKKSFYIVTPISEEEVRVIDVILKGHCDIPPALFSYFNKKLVNCPYVETVMKKKKTHFNDILAALQKPLKLKTSHKKMQRRLMQIAKN